MTATLTVQPIKTSGKCYHARTAPCDRPALISWLRSLDGKGGHGNYVRLTWEKPGHLTLTLRDSEETGTQIHVPVTISGEDRPPVIAFAPGYLGTLWKLAPPCALSTG
jgi:hypothetical protein